MIKREDSDLIRFDSMKLCEKKVQSKLTRNLYINIEFEISFDDIFSVKTQISRSIIRSCRKTIVLQ